MFRVSSFEFRVSSFEFRVSSFEFRVSCFVFRVSCFVFRVSCFVFRVSCFVLRASCFVLRASCFVLRASCLVLYFFKSTETGFDGKPVISMVAEAIPISFFSNDERISLLNRSLSSRISWSSAIKRSVSSSQLSVMR